MQSLAQVGVDSMALLVGVCCPVPRLVESWWNQTLSWISIIRQIPLIMMGRNGLEHFKLRIPIKIGCRRVLFFCPCPKRHAYAFSLFRRRYPLQVHIKILMRPNRTKQYDVDVITTTAHPPADSRPIRLTS
jgi:hypothetical protein